MSEDLFFNHKSKDLQMFHYLTHGSIKLIPHSHGTRVELWCLISGKANMLVEGTEYVLQPGDMVVLQPGEVHTPVVDTSVPFARASVLFRPEMLSELCENESFWEPIFHRKPGTKNLYRARDLDRDVRYYYNQMRQPSKDPRMNIFINTLLLMRHINNAYARKEFSDGVVNEQTRRILHYIGENLGKDLSLDTISQALYISSAQLERTVKRATGVSVGKYIAAKRLSLARQLILDGHRPTQICAVCGYPNYASFFRAYTKYFGHTPKQELTKGNWEPLEFPTA